MSATAAFDLGRRLVTEVLEPMKAAFVGKDEVIDLLGVGLVGGENVFILGPPGTAKSALVQSLGQRLGGETFEYLLTRFTEPNELFGPFDIRRLREGELVTNTTGMLPEASLVFLDELLNANSAILNSLLTVLNERVFRRGREVRKLPTLMVVGASNRLPEDEALGALFDRFLLRVRCDNVPGERLSEVLEAGWRLDVGPAPTAAGFGTDDVRVLQAQLPGVDLTPARPAYQRLIARLRDAGIPISDRRAVKLQRAVAASALLCGRAVVDPSDLWVLRHTWDVEEQQELLATIVDAELGEARSAASAHPRSRDPGAPDPEQLARDLLALGARLDQGPPAAEVARLRDQLGVLAERSEWVDDPDRRASLSARVTTLWDRLGARDA